MDLHVFSARLVYKVGSRQSELQSKTLCEKNPLCPLVLLDYIPLTCTCTVNLCVCVCVCACARTHAHSLSVWY